MPKETRDTVIKEFYQLQIKKCREYATISKKARVNPVDVSNVSMEEFVRRRNEETCGEDCFRNLQEDFSILRPAYSKQGYPEGVLDDIEEEIKRAKEIEGYE
jgi:hypothetical protein